MLGDIRQGGGQLPSQAVVQREIWFNLPAILREQVEASIADIFDLPRALSELIGKAQQKIGVQVACTYVVRASAVVVEGSVDVVVEKLVKLLTTNIHAELEGVIA